MSPENEVPNIPIVDHQVPYSNGATGCIQYGPTQRKMSMFSQFNPMHSIVYTAEIPAFLTLKTSSTPAFPALGEAPLSQCKRGYLFFSLTNTQTTRVIPFYPHPTPILVKSLYLEWDQVMYDLGAQTPEPPGITIVATGLRKSRHQLVHWRDTPCWIVLHCPLAHPVRNPVLKE